MKKTVVAFLIGWLCILSAEAQQISGIRVDSPIPVVVYVNGMQVSSAVQSCFIAGLRRGSYMVEAFPAIRPAHDRRPQKPILSRRVNYSGSDVLVITVEGNFEILPEQPFYPAMGMSPDAFEDLLEMVNKENFDSRKIELLKSLLPDLRLSAKQISSILRDFSFDSDREKAVSILYPCCVDKENFFIVLKTFQFESNGKRALENVKRRDR